jgi:hypothetical protein
VLTDGGKSAGPEENTTTSDDHGASAGELDDEKRVLRVTDLEYVGDAEVEHVRCADVSHARLGDRAAQRPEW